MMANKLTSTEFEFRSKELFSYLAYGLSFNASCELAGLDPDRVQNKVDRGKELYLRGADLGTDIEYYQEFTRAKYALQLDALENLKAISDNRIASSWQASRLLLQLNAEERQERDNGVLPDVLRYLYGKNNDEETA